MRSLVEELVVAAFQEAVEAEELPPVENLEPGVERPRDPKFGDWASSIALRAGAALEMQTREVAKVVAKHIVTNAAIESVEVAGPGFINIRLNESALHEIFRSVRSKGSDYGKGRVGEGMKVDVEFISANPTGPMHLGHGRWAALGDAICRLLSFSGYEVTREFYINDAGNQMDVFAESVAVRYLQVARLVAEGRSLDEAHEMIVSDMETYREELPENCYAGSYIVDIAARIYDDEGSSWVDADAQKRSAHFKESAYTAVLTHVKDVLDGFGLDFDVWFSERSLHAIDADGASAISKTIDILRERGYIYEAEGALWLRTTDFGDDKDRVLVKADGAYTYFAPDITYHRNKFDRGFDRCIDILGADHHGYVKRIQAVGAIFDHPGQPEVIIGQMVNLFRDGQAVRMSKRTGEMVTFEELIEEVGIDATRYLMLSRSTDQQIDFDITQAKKRDASNPVYYVQYAHARICSVLRKADGESDASPDDIAERLIPIDADLSFLTDESELALARRIDEFAETIEVCTRDLAPFRLTHYAQSLAADFHQFYTRCHVLTEDAALTTARLYVVDATRRVLESTLGLLGVSAPTSM